MRFWWVNQNQTFRQEVDGGYLWSPKRNANGARNPFYESMREISPGDLILSFVDTRIACIGIAASYCYESPKPLEFGEAGLYWNNVGWRVRVNFQRLEKQLRPKDQIEFLRPFLPNRYAPLQANGNGIQSVYLTELSPELFGAIATLIGAEATQIRERAANLPLQDRQVVAADMELWEHHLENEVDSNTAITSTERQAVIMARRGQGLFRERVARIEHSCRITKVDNPAHLRASHAKPWRDCNNNDERLDGENGLLLTPSIDHLFDRGFITFEDAGQLVLSPIADLPALERMGVPVNVGGFTAGQRHFLEYYRNSVFLESRK
jgi:putative restriction endonuclease